MNQKFFSFRRALAIARKEVFHIVRDPFTIAMAAGIPVIMVLFFGFAIDFDFRDIRLAVLDHDRSRASREAIRPFDSSGYFHTLEAGEMNPVAVVESEKAFASIVINPGFGKELAATGGARAQILVDGTDNMKSGVVAGYIAGIQRAITHRINGEQKTGIIIVPRYVYNPELNTHWFIVPGLIVVITGLLSILLTALTIAREWEYGSMELLLSTPVTPLEIIAGKIMPYAGMGLTSIALVYAVARLVFAIPFNGNYLLFILACLLFTTASLSQGLLISVIARHQQKAMQAALISGLLPSLLLSGFIFPVESMPAFFRHLTMILPARWFMEIIRSLVLKGSAFNSLLAPFLALGLMNILLVGVAVKRFKRTIEP